MTRLSIIAVLISAGCVVAQDMPLHEIIKAGESWRTASKFVPPEPTLYTVDTKAKTVVRDQKKYEVSFAEPSCTAHWHNGSTLLVGDAGGKHVWAFRIEQDGSLKAGDKYIALRVRKGETRSEVSALCVDRSQRVYAATKEGIQIFDPTGRMCGVITSPTIEKITGLTFIGNELYAVAGGKTFVRTMTAEGSEAK
jgi:gluconolactonase